MIGKKGNSIITENILVYFRECGAQKMQSTT